MQAAGYRTAAFVANPWMEKRFGFAQGFDVYDDSFAQWGIKGEVVSRTALAVARASCRLAASSSCTCTTSTATCRTGCSIDRTSRAAPVSSPRTRGRLASPRRWRSRPFRASPTASPRSPRDIGRAELDRIVVRQRPDPFDGALAAFLDGFKQHWAFDNTAIIITSDHGEALFERGYGNHGNGLFDDEVAIPLAARFPGTRADQKRITCPVGLIDVMPSLCTYLGLKCPRPMFGTSFISAPGRSDGQRRYIVTEGVVQRPAHRAIRNGTYKLLWETEVLADGTKKENPYSLYDVATDPQERHDLLKSSERSSQTERAFKTMASALRDAVPAFAEPSKTYAPVDPQTRERLRALGYTD